MRIGGGYWLMFLLIAFLGWAYLFEIDESVRAQGSVVPVDRTQIVQVADGGVLSKLYVVEGQRVKQGEVLASLEKERSQASADEIQAQIAHLQIAIIRARAEAEGYKPDFGDFIKSDPSVVAAQRALYKQHQQALNDKVDSLKQSLILAKDEQRILRKLLKTGDIAKLDVVRIERDTIDLESRIQAANNDLVTEARTEITSLEQELARQLFRMEEQKSILAHTEIIAPMDGVVKYLRLNTLGGVLRSGDELMQISPTGGGNIIEAKIMPADIGRLRLGLPVTIRLDAFDSSIYGVLQGQLDYISSDTLTERGANDTPQTSYRGNISLIETQDNPKLSTHQLRPGMNATIDIRTGKRSVLQFLAKPILRSFSGALSQP